MRWSLLAVALFALAPIAAVPAGAAAAAAHEERIVLGEGRPSATVRGAVAGGGTARYRVRVGAGQRLAATLAMDDARGTLILRAPGPGAVLFDGANGGRIGDVIVAAGGDHVVEVALRDAAAGDGPAAFALTVEVTGGDPGPRRPDFADGLAGGPDFVQVAGLAAGKRLAVRTQPSTAGALVARLAVGTLLRNRGCRRTGNARWCRVERPDGGDGGWAAGRFLVEATAGGGIGTAGGDRPAEERKGEP